MKTIRIQIVEDDADYRYLMERTLRKEPLFELCSVCEDSQTALTDAIAKNPDIVLMDLNLSGKDLDGIEAARAIRLSTNARVIILTSYEDHETIIRASTRAFASAYLYKSSFSSLVPLLIETAQSVTPQAHLICSLLLSPLTDAERSVLQYTLGQDVGLHSSSKTIANQLTGILRKLGLSTKKELIHIFRAYGYNLLPDETVSDAAVRKTDAKASQKLPPPDDIDTPSMFTKIIEMRWHPVSFYHPFSFKEELFHAL